MFVYSIAKSNGCILYIDFPDQIKKVTINPVNNDNKCFQYAATVALNHEETGKKS